ncbi:MAG: hypothetical protein RMX68_022890 [Aulosira sp. ZfuVER01]|nr:hypothetical protein [Aulosira sp. ZfuVER01]MDZ8001351.1 hypothetical protein [Aulosira sp. DedVER01a]MDZ8051007.1 hypothetical protein [Aulosira sp. ZfuCHP01]
MAKSDSVMNETVKGILKIRKKNCDRQKLVSPLLRRWPEYRYNDEDYASCLNNFDRRSQLILHQAP